MDHLHDIANDEDILSEIFEKATQFVRSVAGKLSNDDLLFLYARFKQANEGPCNTQRPGFFDFQGKQKWDAWKKLGTKTKNDAMLEYISQLDSIMPEWKNQIESGEVKSSAAFGVAVSKLSSTEENIPDEQKSVFDWCKEGNVKMVSRCLSEHKCDVNTKDEEGLCLLHWACDRGHTDVVAELIKLHASINETDEEGQTPLHYAVSCEHEEVLKVLLASGADISIKDNDGFTPEAVAESPEIKAFFLPKR